MVTLRIGESLKGVQTVLVGYVQLYMYLKKPQR